MKKTSTNKFIYIATVMLSAVLALLCIPQLSASADTAESTARAEIVITANGKEFVYRDEYLTPSDFTVAEQIEMRRINAPLREKIELVDYYLSKGADYKTALGVCYPLLHRTVESVARHLYVPYKDAEVVYAHKTFSVKNSALGRELDENRLYASVYYTLKYSGGGVVKAPVSVLQPNIDTKSLQAELYNLSAYSTDYTTSPDARAHNVTLALERFDGLSISPGESVSFNSVVGPRTEERGFKKAKIIVDGKYTDGVGGGVCQASTAIYNAALIAGLNCSANSHSICPSYCPPGLDAMISGASDLVITNTSARTVRISVQMYDKSARVRFFGQKLDYRIEPESVVVKTLRHECLETVDTEHKYFDASAVCGDRQLIALGKDGYVSETYLKYYDAYGALIKRIKIRTNEYKSTPQIIAVAP